MVLSVAALLRPAISALKDVAVGFAEISLSGFFGVDGCIGWERALCNRQWIGAGSGGKDVHAKACDLGLLDRQLLSFSPRLSKQKLRRAASRLRGSSPMAL